MYVCHHSRLYAEIVITCAKNTYRVVISHQTYRLVSNFETELLTGTESRY